MMIFYVFRDANIVIFFEIVSHNLFFTGITH